MSDGERGFSLRVKRGRNFLGMRSLTSFEGELQGTIPVTRLGEEMLSLCRELPFFSFVAERSEIENLRGRPRETLPTARLEEQKRREELFFAQCEIFSIPERNSIDERHLGESESTMVECLIESEFQRFAGSRKIVHSFRRHVSPLLERSLPEVTPELLSQMVPARLRSFRLGVEHFRSRFLGSLVGSPPVVASRFYLEVDEERVWFLTDQDSSIAKRGELSEFVQRLDRALERCGLKRGLKRELIERL